MIYKKRLMVDPNMQVMTISAPLAFGIQGNLASSSFCVSMIKYRKQHNTQRTHGNTKLLIPNYCYQIVFCVCNFCFIFCYKVSNQSFHINFKVCHMVLLHMLECSARTWHRVVVCHMAICNSWVHPPYARLAAQATSPPYIVLLYLHFRPQCQCIMHQKMLCRHF